MGSAATAELREVDGHGRRNLVGSVRVRLGCPPASCSCATASRSGTPPAAGRASPIRRSPTSDGGRRWPPPTRIGAIDAVFAVGPPAGHGDGHHHRRDHRRRPGGGRRRLPRALRRRVGGPHPRRDRGAAGPATSTPPADAHVGFATSTPRRPPSWEPDDAVLERAVAALARDRRRRRRRRRAGGHPRRPRSTSSRATSGSPSAPRPPGQRRRPRGGGRRRRPPPRRPLPPGQRRRHPGDRPRPDLTNHESGAATGEIRHQLPPIRSRPVPGRAGFGHGTGGVRGTIGRYHWESEPWWPDRAGAAGRRAERAAWSCSTTSASPSSAASAPTSRRRTSTALAAGGLRYANFHTTALCSPTRACVLTGRNHHAVRHGPDHRPGHRLPGLRRPHPAGRARCCPRCSTPARLRRRTRSASGTSRPRTRTHLGARRDRWPLGRGFERFYGFFRGETHQFVAGARARQPPRRAARRSLEDGYHLTEDLVDHAIEFVARPAPRRRRQAVLPATSPPAPATRPTRRRRTWIERYRGRFDAGLGRVAGRDARPPDGDRACCPRHTELSPRPDWVPAWDDLSATTSGASTPATWRRSPASCPTPTHAARPARSTFLEEHRRARRHARDRRCPTTAPRRRAGPIGSLNDVRAWNVVPPARRRGRSRASTRSAGPASTTTTRGAGRSPATRRSAAGSARSTRAASPIR